jgi:hypothetical protein
MVPSRRRCSRRLDPICFFRDQPLWKILCEMVMISVSSGKTRSMHTLSELQLSHLYMPVGGMFADDLCVAANRGFGWEERQFGAEQCVCAVTP